MVALADDILAVLQCSQNNMMVTKATGINGSIDIMKNRLINWLVTITSSNDELVAVILVGSFMMLLSW